MTDPTTDLVLPRRGVATRALVFILAVLTSLAMYALLVRPLDETHRIWLPELRSQDLLVRLRPGPAVHPDIVEVALNNNVRRMVTEEGDPIGGRSVYARLIRRIAAEGARAIVLDTYLPERTRQAEDEALWRAMADTGRVFLPVKYQPLEDSVLTPAEYRNLRELEYSVLHAQRTTVVPDAETEAYAWWRFQPPVWDFTRNAAGGGAAGTGMAVYLPDADRVVRSLQYAYLTNIVYPPGLRPSNLQRQWDVQNVFVPSQVLPPVMRMFEVDKQFIGVHLGRHIQLAGDLDPEVLLPMDEWARAPISFAGPPGTIPAVNAANVLDGDIPEGTFDGKLVVIGVTGPYPKADNLITPMSTMHPRMDVTAQAINSILMRKPLIRLSHMAFVPLMLLGIVAGLVIPYPFRVGRITLAAILVLLLYVVVAWLLAIFGVLLPVLTAALTILVTYLLTMIFTLIFPV